MQHRRPFSLAAIFFVSSILLAAQQQVTVRTVDELVRAIGPNRVVILKAGVYDLSTAKVSGDNPHVAWNGNGDGRELVITETDNLTLRGETGATIVTAPRFANVTVVRLSGAVRFESLTMGHTEGGICSGGVIRFENSKDPVVENCDLYGSGAMGISFDEVTGARVIGTVIRDCTSGAVEIHNSSELSFERVNVRGNTGMPLVLVSGGYSIAFGDCDFSGNSGSAIVGIYGESQAVAFDSCRFTSNTCPDFDGGKVPPIIGENTFADNAFGSPGLGHRGYDEPYALPSGLAFSFGRDMALSESGNGNLTVETGDYGCMGGLTATYELRKQDNLAKFPEKVFSSALAALNADLKGTGISLRPVKAESVRMAGGIVTQVVRAKVSDGSESLVGFYAYNDWIYTFLFLFPDGDMFSKWEGEARAILGSVTEAHTE